MFVLIQFSTIAMLLLIVPEISPYRVNSPNDEFYLQEKLLQSQLDKEYIGIVNSLINDYEDDEQMLMDLNALKDTRYRWEKRNGDLINFLLGLPKGMLDAGR